MERVTPVTASSILGSALFAFLGWRAEQRTEK